MLALATVASRADSRGYSIISSYSGTETGSHSRYFATAQDKNGILYFAGSGLLTFDGDHWKKVATPSAYAIRSLDFGPDGRLWAGLIGDLGWFEKDKNQEWVFHSLHAKIPEAHSNIGDVFGVYAHEKGAIFVCSDVIVRWDGSRVAVEKMETGKKLFSNRSNGRIFVHRVEHGLYEVDHRESRLVLARAILGDTGIPWTERTDAGWRFGTSLGFFSSDGVTRTPLQLGIEDFLAAGRLSTVCRLPDGRIAVGTVKEGIAVVHPDGTGDFRLSDATGLPSPYITSLFVDRDGELWATSDSHILRIDIRGRSTVFDARAGLPRQTYRKIAKANERIFVGNESGVFALEDDGNRFVSIESLRGRWHHLGEAPQGLLVSGFRSAQLWDGRTAAPVRSTNLDVWVTVARPNGDLLLADYRSIFERSSDGVLRELVHNLTDPVTSLAQDLHGRLWIGTLGRGAFVASLRSDAPVEAESTAGRFGLPRLAGSTHVRTNAAGTVMVFADNGAWQKAAPAGEFARVIDFPIRNVAAVSDLAADGTIWVAHENTDTRAPCIGRISALGRGARWEPHAIDGLLEVGAPRSIFADAAASGETVLWIGGTNALLRHQVGSSLAATAPRPPLLRAFVRDAVRGTRAPILAALPYSTALLEFEFAAPEFSRRSLLRIETRIEGVDDEWTPIAPGSRREFTAIRDGRYTVKARVVAETGAISEETSFAFTVLPPWSRTVPGLTTYGLATALLILGAYRLRVRTLRRRNESLEMKIRERTRELEAANAAKTQFVANMSHDIRNPLNGIVGLALALEDTRLDSRQLEIVSTLRECTTYLSSLVDDVLDFASIEAGRVELRPRVFGPRQLLGSIVATLKADATASGAVLSVESGADVPENLFGDAGRVQQILVNFVSNALKYAGGNILISVRTPPGSPGEVEFAVADQGAGISAAEQATLFTKFSRLRQQRGGEEIPGTGLGLAACRLLADIMGGSVGVQSTPGEGAKFFLRLPLTIATGPIGEPAACLPNTSVLLVEDTDYNAWAAAAVLAKLGLSCDRARTGAEALQLFSEKRYNVVLLDRNLPDMDGTEVARRMRRMESDGLQAVLLAVTAYCTAADRAICLQSGMDAFVGKPLTPEKLRKVLIDAGRRLLASVSVQIPSELPAAGLDISLLHFLSDGSADGLEVQVRRFIASLHEAEAHLNTAALADDFDAVAVAAHRVLGQGKMVGAASLVAAATQLESAARAGDAAACTEWRQRVTDESQAVMEAMRHRRPAGQSA